MTLKLKPWSTVSRIDKIAMKVEPCPISKLDKFVVVKELGMNAMLKLWQVVTVNENRGNEVKSQNMNIICTCAHVYTIFLLSGVRFPVVIAFYNLCNMYVLYGGLL